MCKQKDDVTYRWTLLQPDLRAVYTANDSVQTVGNIDVRTPMTPV